ncbi:uncharacterized protein PV07_07688 [Cladophialophora immunda]|uniref:Uncharacterized protein n=1 Tax=Cladophialophora immunda TaxID=569365 RepID=A0A0D1ZJ70_9EURO|nr:uncharacterized protein PV07_07688 [Cladophialophora immunda]KIW27996.1 hypothetical protein PV07_07688 [Cladophialophora immunda]
MMDQTTIGDGAYGFPNERTLSLGSPDTGSHGFARHVEMQDEWPSSRELTQRSGQYDAQGFLIDFEHSTAYLLPRKAPSPPSRNSRVSPSSHTRTTLVDDSSEASEAFEASEPLIAIPYESTSRAESHTPAWPQIRFSNSYRKWWLEQYSRPKPPVELATRRSARANWQGFWLARGTLRRSDKVIEQHGPGYWLTRGTMKAPEQFSGAESAERPHRFWKRVSDKIRIVSSEEK